MKNFVFSILLTFISTVLIGQYTENADSALVLATLKEKPVLLYFSGSDWCPNCLRFERNILSDSVFSVFIDEKLVMLRADFPQKKKLPAEVLRQNEQLAESFNPSGRFPAFVLLTPDMKAFSYVNYINQKPSEFITVLKEKIKTLSAGE